ncbi:MAG: IgGFc-binding protein [Deltaproteobacteria bacterium]|nr:IgGFc-binding protein [Deltaproteobacteria bacterium]
MTCVFILAACGPSHRNPGGGDDAPASACTPDGAHRCEGATYETCEGGIWTSTADCPTGCVDSIGCVACNPGSTFCKDGNVWTCDASGNPGSMTQACTGAQVCQDGVCVDACADAAMNRSYVGCEYVAVDLDNALEVEGESQAPFGCALFQNTTQKTLNVCYNASGAPTVAGLCDPPATMGGAATCPATYTCQSKAVCILDAQHSPFAVVVSNPQSRDVHVTVTGPGGQMIMKTVAAGQVQAILPQAMNAIPDASVDGSFKGKAAYKVVSDLPIVAYQFNPLDNSNVFSNDASLLIPRTAFDIDYYTMAYPTLDRRTPAPGSNPYYGYLTVVAWADNTQIQVTPTAPTTASATNTTLAAGTPAQFTLNAFEVLQLEASGTGDLTGTHVTSTNMMPFGMFAGHEATVFGESTPPDSTHTSGPCCADHLEEMMFPSSTWGKTFAISRSQQRTNEPDMLRIMAQKPNTTVTFTPAPASGTCGTLGPGQFCEVKIQGDTEISASDPVLVGHYLEASIWQDALGGSSVGTGDPSMAIAVPTEQFRTDYTILIPSQYAANYISIAAASTGGVTVDMAPATLMPFPGGGTHRAARIMVAAGQHTIHCADGCGVTVYGYDNAVSYMFAGGLDLKQIVIQ